MATVSHVVALSGGKDSTAMALRLAEVEPRDYTYVCTPTGDELPEMIDHWLNLGNLLGKPLLPVTCGESLKGLIRRQVMLPNHRARWCTRMLKIEPYYRWLEKLGACVSYVGLRADEEGRQGMSFPEGDKIEVRFPLREWGWGIKEVWDYLTRKNITIPSRTDCARCYHQRLGEWWNLWKDYPDIFDDAVGDEKFVSKERGAERTFRSPQRDTAPAALADLRERFKAGYIPAGASENLDLFGGRPGMCRVCSL